MMAMQQQRSAPPRREQYTTWVNPTDTAMFVEVYNGNEAVPTRYDFPPHEEVQVPSRFDTAIHRGQCGQRECQNKGGWCLNADHRANVVGGLAPMLQRKGSNWKVLPALDPLQAELEATKAQLVAESIVRKKAEDAQILAAARATELEQKLEEATRPADVAKPAPPPAAKSK